MPNHSVAAQAEACANSRVSKQAMLLRHKILRSAGAGQEQTPHGWSAAPVPPAVIRWAAMQAIVVALVVLMVPIAHASDLGASVDARTAVNRRAGLNGGSGRQGPRRRHARPRARPGQPRHTSSWRQACQDGHDGGWVRVRQRLQCWWLWWL